MCTVRLSGGTRSITAASCPGIATLPVSINHCAIVKRQAVHNGFKCLYERPDSPD